MAKKATQDGTEEVVETTATATETTNETTNETLENFEWDETGEGNFFGIENTAVVDEVEEVIEQIKKDDDDEEEEGDDKPKPVAVEEEEEEENFFGVQEEGKPAKKKETEEDTPDYYVDAFSKMKEDGVFQNMELPEDEELTVEKFIELQDSEVESRVDETFEGFFSEMDDDGAAFLKHKKEGGSTADFFKVYSQSTGAPQGDLDDEVYQEKLARYYYKNVDGEDSDDIDDKVEWLKDSGKLEKYAQKFDTKIKDDEKKAKEDLKKAQAEAVKAADEGKKAFVSSVKEALDNIEQVDNFKFTPKSKKSLLPFITKPTVKVGKNKYVTGMQSKLQTALKTPEKMLILAQLLENDFDLSDIVADGVTVKTRQIKKNIQRQKTEAKPKGSGRISKKRSLSDIDF